MSSSRALFLVVHVLVALALTLVAFFIAVFYLGSKDAYEELIREHFWSTLGLRLGSGLLAGCIGLATWWLLCLAVAKFEGKQWSHLPTYMALAAAGPLVGAVVGSVLFCLG